MSLAHTLFGFEGRITRRTWCGARSPAVVAALLLYAQDFDGVVIIQAVNDIEMPATNLGSKIWQTIAILQAAMQGAERAGAAT
jgi:hypothetical protein